MIWMKMGRRKEDLVFVVDLRYDYYHRGSSGDNLGDFLRELRKNAKPLVAFVCGINNICMIARGGGTNARNTAYHRASLKLDQKT